MVCESQIEWGFYCFRNAISRFIVSEMPYPEAECVNSSGLIFNLFDNKSVTLKTKDYG